MPNIELAQTIEIAGVLYHTAFFAPGDAPANFTLNGAPVQPTITGSGYAAYTTAKALYFTGTADLPLYQYYQGISPQLSEKDYCVLPHFEKAIGRFPATSPRLQAYSTPNGTSYYIKNVMVVAQPADILAAMLASTPSARQTLYLQQWQALQGVQPVADDTALAGFGTRYLPLLASGCFGQEVFTQAYYALPSLKGKADAGKSFYYFATYLYAMYVDFNIGAHDYATFHEKYGRHLYSVQISLNGTTSGLVWTDYIYHPPEHHVELGFGDAVQSGRFAGFGAWQPGDTLTLRLVADTYQDVVLSVPLKRPLQNHTMLAPPRYTLQDTLALSLDGALLSALQKSPEGITLTARTGAPVPPAVYAGALQFDLPAQQLRLAFAQCSGLAPGTYFLTIQAEDFANLFYIITLEEHTDGK